MLVWINGAFGVGKTHVAAELARRVPTAHVADPELIGSAIHRMLPPAVRDDFQHRPQWRSAVVATLTDAVAAHEGPVLVPMTLVEPMYFDEIVGGLRAGGVDVRHVALMASPATVRRRLRRRGGFGLGAALGRPETWASDRVESCLDALSGSRFALHVSTEGRALGEVVEQVAELVDLGLERPRHGAVRRATRRLAVTLRHVR